jgi:hypothetical protein
VTRGEHLLGADVDAGVTDYEGKPMRRCQKRRAATAGQLGREVKVLAIMTFIQVTLTVGLNALATAVLAWAR